MVLQILPNLTEENKAILACILGTLFYFGLPSSSIPKNFAKTFFKAIGTVGFGYLLSEFIAVQYEDHRQARAIYAFAFCFLINPVLQNPTKALSIAKAILNFSVSVLNLINDNKPNEKK